jgi:cell division septal protein FtsQ
MEQVFKRRTITMEVLQNQRYKKRVRRIVFYTGLFLIVTAVFLLVAFAVFFKVRTINITGNSRYTLEDVNAVLPVKLNANLYSFKAEEVELVVKKELPYVGSVKVTRTIPSTLNIEITEAKPVMYINIGYDYYLLSDELRVLDHFKDKSLLPPDVIELKASTVLRCIVGETASFVDTRSYNAITELYSQLRMNGIEKDIRMINIVSRFDITLQYTDRFSIYLGDMDDADIKIRFLIGIFEKLDAEDKGKIDISDSREATVALI